MSNIKIILDSDKQDSKDELKALVFALVETCIDHSIPVSSAELDGEIIFKNNKDNFNGGKNENRV